MNPNITGPQLDEDIKARSKILTVFVFILFAILIMRLIDMQIISGAYYENLSRNNRIRMVSIKAPRGKIIDREGAVLADNRPAYNVMMMPEDISNVGMISLDLSRILEQTETEIEARIRDAKTNPYDPVFLARDVSFNEVAMIEAEIFSLPGISIDVTPERDYVFKDLAPHVLGFLGEISKRELDSSARGDYRMGDLIGKSGIELACEKILRGTKGARVFEVDALGRKIRVVDERAPVAGDDVVLTIDKDLQIIARDALAGRAGAVVALAPSTGEVLTMVSTPLFDPSMFLSPIAPESWNEITSDPLHPLENRAIRGQYPPGSVFKIVVALAALSEGILDPGKEIDCPGYYALGNSIFRCWKSDGHGPIAFKESISQSCDVYFYLLGEKLGIDRMTAMGHHLGFGRPTGIDFGDEASGLMPTTEWKQKRFGEPWHPGESIISAIGQGYTLVTPLQVAKAMSAVVNGGRVITPKILASTETKLEKMLDIPPEYLVLVKEGLRAAVEGERGTARAIRDPMFSVGGKTGTAQVVKGYTSKLPDEADIPYRYRDHAWFFGFSPVEKPEIMVVAVVEHGGHGASIAAPIVRDVIKGYYFLKGTSNEQVRQDNR
ncbi:MAG: penicillin-binding protein 2 [Desulfomonilia bacterium]